MIDIPIPTTTSSTHNGLPTTASLTNPLRIDILDRLELLFHRMSSHQAFLFFGCEIGFPSNLLCPPGNCLLLAFERRFVDTFRSVGMDVRYAWSRDQVPNEQNQSYSFVALVSTPPGAQLPSCLRLAKSLWYGHTLGVGTGHELMRPFAGEGILLRAGEPDFPEALARAFHAASCLARFDTKRMAHGPNSFGSSRV